ncbi:Mitomycin radical oxidase [Frankia sp. AgKG'84/4]
MTPYMSRRAALKAGGAGLAAYFVETAVGAAPAHAGAATARDLSLALRGKVLLPGDPDYDAERVGFNTLVQHHPNAIVMVESARDVATAVGVGARIGWPIAVQTTGHGVSVPADGALLINMRGLTGVNIDAGARTATISGGVRWRDVVAAAAPVGLLPPVGSTSNVGAVGYVTGGGVPIMGRTYGYAADRVRSIDLVTLDGRLRRLSATREPDLFWAVRGGKSNFGAVTAFEIDLLPQAQVYAGNLTFPAASAEEAFRAYVRWTEGVSDQLTSVATFLRYPDVPQVPPQLRGVFVLLIRIVYVGSARDGAAEIAALRALGPSADTVAEIPVDQVDTVFSVPTTPGATPTASGLVGGLSDDGVATILAAVGPGVTLPAGFVEIRHMAGAFGRGPSTANALGHRDAEFLVFISNTVPDTVAPEPVEQAQQRIVGQLGPVLTGGRVPTFLGPLDTSVEAVRSAYDPAGWNRLLKIKKTWDPRNLFRINHNIR